MYAQEYWDGGDDDLNNQRSEGGKQLKFDDPLHPGPLPALIRGL